MRYLCLDSGLWCTDTADIPLSARLHSYFQSLPAPPIADPHAFGFALITHRTPEAVRILRAIISTHPSLPPAILAHLEATAVWASSRPAVSALASADAAWRAAAAPLRATAWSLLYSPPNARRSHAHAFAAVPHVEVMSILAGTFWPLSLALAPSAAAVASTLATLPPSFVVAAAAFAEPTLAGKALGDVLLAPGASSAADAQPSAAAALATIPPPQRVAAVTILSLIAAPHPPTATSTAATGTGCALPDAAPSPAGALLAAVLDLAGGGLAAYAHAAGALAWRGAAPPITQAGAGRPSGAAVTAVGATAAAGDAPTLPALLSALPPVACCALPASLADGAAGAAVSQWAALAVEAGAVGAAHTHAATGSRGLLDPRESWRWVALLAAFAAVFAALCERSAGAAAAAVAPACSLLPAPRSGGARSATAASSAARAATNAALWRSVSGVAAAAAALMAHTGYGAEDAAWSAPADEYITLRLLTLGAQAARNAYGAAFVVPLLATWPWSGGSIATFARTDSSAADAAVGWVCDGVGTERQAAAMRFIALIAASAAALHTDSPAAAAAAAAEAADAAVAAWSGPLVAAADAACSAALRHRRFDALTASVAFLIQADRARAAISAAQVARAVLTAAPGKWIASDKVAAAAARCADVAAANACIRAAADAADGISSEYINVESEALAISAAIAQRFAERDRAPAAASWGIDADDNVMGWRAWDGLAGSVALSCA